MARRDDDDFDQDDSLADEESGPRARTSMLTIVLALLNIPAALGFAFLLMLTYQKRQEWSYEGFKHDLYMQGLPLKMEATGTSASRETLPRQRLGDEQLRAVFADPQRGGKSFGGEKFAPVDEILKYKITGEHLTPEVLKDYFKDLGDPVATLEEEVFRIKDKVPAEIQKAAKEAAASAKTPEAKQKMLRDLLLPLAYNFIQVEALDKRIKEAKGDDLDSLVLDAAERRLLIDFLAPYEIYRPGDILNQDAYVLERAADLDKFELKSLRSLLQKRIDNSIAENYDPLIHQGTEWAKPQADGKPPRRDSIERRRAVAFLLVNLATLNKPDGTPIFARGLERAQAVVGLFEFTLAIQELTKTWPVLEQRIASAIKNDREGFEMLVQGVAKVGPAFLSKHKEEIDRIRDLKNKIDDGRRSKATLKDQADRAEKLYEDRKEHQKIITDKLIEARKETARQLDQVRELQAQLYQAQLDLAEAAKQNFELEERIRRTERFLSSGGKLPEDKQPEVKQP